MYAACIALNVILVVYGMTEKEDRIISGPRSLTPKRRCHLVHLNYRSMADHFKGVERLHDQDSNG